MAGENSTIHRAVYNAPAGSVLAIDADGYDQRAVWGEILTVAAKHGGIAGVVIDGAVRDIDAIRERSYPVFARAVCAAGPHKGWRGRIGTTIQCGGVVVSPGDILVCDEDGVVVVPREGAEEIAAVARERLALESSWIERVDAGRRHSRSLEICREAKTNRGTDPDAVGTLSTWCRGDIRGFSV